MSIKMHMPPLTSVRGQTLLTDTKPYLFRQSPIESQMLDLTLTGGTVAVNQLVENGNFADATGWSAQEPAQTSLTISDGVATVALTSAPAYVSRPALKVAGVGEMVAVIGHKYLISVDAKTTIPNAQNLYFRSSSLDNKSTNGLSADWQSFGWIGNATSANAVLFYIGCSEAPANASVGDGISFRNVMIFDLTQMFGTTIADYVYSLEQGTAGSGIAWLKSFGFFTEDYYPYDAGSLLSTKTSGHKVTGKNLADLSFMEFDDSTYTHSFFPSQAQAMALAETLNKLRGQTVFYSAETTGTAIGQAIGQFRFYAGNNLLKRFNPNESTTVPDVDFTQFTSMSVYGSTTGASISKLQIEYGSTATSYEPYTEHTYPLSDIELRGIPKLDASNNLYYDGDTYASDGTVTRKYGIVDLGTLNWSMLSAGRFYSTSIRELVKKGSSAGGYNHVKCVPYVAENVASLSGLSDKAMSVDSGGNLQLKDSAYSSASDLETAMDGVMLVYELATETAETTDAFENPQLAGTTEEYVDSRTVPMPVGHTTEYFNMVQIEKIQMHMGQTQAIKMHMPKGD